MQFVSKKNRFLSSLNFFVFSNLFIAFCAVFMVCQTQKLLHLSHLPTVFLLFVFFATLSSYSLHWYLTEPAENSIRNVWNVENRKILRGLFCFSVVGGSVCFWFLRAFWVEILGIGFVTFLYTAPKIPVRPFTYLRGMAVGKTFYLAASWVFVTTILPIFIAQETWQIEYIWFVLNRLFLVFSVCLLFDFRDQTADRAAKIKSITVFLNPQKLSIVLSISLLCGVFSGLRLHEFGFSWLIFSILSIPFILLFFLFRYVIRERSDYLYFIILDGLMAISSILTLFL